MQESLYEGGEEAIARSKPRIFLTQQSDLIQMFDGASGLNKLRELGYADGILKGIVSERTTGIIGDKEDLLRRQGVYGENIKPLPPASSIIESFKQEVKNVLWVIIGVTALVAAICGIYAKGWSSISEGLFLFIFAFIMILITSVVDYCKDKKFIQLQSLLIDEKITVIRGKFGATERVSVWSLTVGDIIMVSDGQRVPADCLVLESADFEVDEEPEKKLRLQRDENGNKINNNDLNLDHTRKGPYTQREEDEQLQCSNNYPFVRADSLTTRGNAKLLVCCTGEMSTRGVRNEKLEDDSEDTKLQKALKNLGQQFTNYSLIVCIVILVILIVMTFIVATTQIEEGSKDDSSTAGIIFELLPLNINLFVVLVVVAIPEGLPLTIQISLAFSVMRMYSRDKILLKKQDALEIIAEIQEFIIGKTSIVTTGYMKVKKFYLEGRSYNINRPDTLFNCELKHQTIKLLQEGIIYNNSAYVEMGETKWIPVGNSTEVGLLKFLQNADIPIHTLISERFSRKVVATVHLASEEGKRFTACAVDEGDQYINIHIKGATESVLPLVTSISVQEGKIEAMPQDEQEGNVRSQYINSVNDMAGAPLRVIAFAHADMPLEAWQQALAANPQSSANEVLASLLLPGGQGGLENINLVGALGLEDKVRGKARSALKHTATAGINVRMVSGDMRRTAEAVALQVGLVTAQEIQEARSAQDRGESNAAAFVVMDAATFDAEVMRGGSDSPAQLQAVLKHLKVLAKASPSHRGRILAGLQAMGKKVAVTGGGIADVDALHKADIALTMGSGCSAAKEVADMILTDDDYEATLRAVMWGRNIYHNVGRFLQFQVTVNISCLLVVAFAAFFLGESPFSSVQLLWINLIMDTLAAFALGTEPPLPSVVAGQPYENMRVMQPQIWRQIYGMSIWNALVLMCVVVFAPLTMDNMVYKLTSKPIIDVENKENSNKLRHMTYMFHIFVFLQLFNQINCRKDGIKEYNVFAKFFHNFYFLAVLCVEFAFQFLCPATIMRTAELNKREWGMCLMIGATPLLISVLLKCTPRHWVEKLSGGPIDETKEGPANALTKGFNTLANTQVGAKGDDDAFNKEDVAGKDTNA